MTEPRLNRYRDTAALVVATIVYVALWRAYPHQFNASDPWAYSLRAYNFMAHYDFGFMADPELQTFDFRIGAWLPVSLFYGLFGVTILTTHLWSLVAALAVMAIVWAALPDLRSRLIGLVLCLTAVPLFEAAVDLYPDLIVAAFMAASVLLLNARASSAARTTAWWLAPALAVVCPFVAFLAKLSAYWVLPVWLFAFACDLRSDERARLLRRFYAPAIATWLVLGILYLGFNHAVWGDALARFKVVAASIAAEQAHPDIWWSNYTGHGLLRRLTIEPALMLYRAYGAVVVLAILSAFILPRGLRLWAIYTATCTGMFWFGPTSLTPYDVLPLHARYILPALPGLYILAAYFASRLRVAADGGAAGNALALALVLAIACLPFVKYMRSWQRVDLGEAHAMRQVKDEVAANAGKRYALITADARSAEALKFYFGYELPKNLTMVAAAYFERSKLAADKYFLFANDDRSAFLKQAYGETVFNDAFRAAGAPLVLRQGAVSLYAADRLPAFK
jgi:hypothetical protein